MKIKGNFCRGIPQEDEKEEEEESKSYLARFEEWVSSKFEKKQDDDKKVEEEDKKEVQSDETKKEEDKKDEKKKEEKKNNLDDMLTLKDINLEIKKGEFVCIIGETGCGKTSLLLSMLGDLLYIPQSEIDIVGGDIERNLTAEELKAMTYSVNNLNIEEKDAPIKLSGNLSYVEQQAWIQNRTLRDNVLFGREFKKKKYVETMLACQLEPDLKEMCAGDLSEIGEKGINLSGGQKARVSLARACYKDSDIVLMDDPISALDAHVRKQIFMQVFQGLLKDKTRILVTHAIDFVHLADRVVIMNKGKVAAQGTYEELRDNEYMKEVMDIHKAHE